MRVQTCLMMAVLIGAVLASYPPPPKGKGPTPVPKTPTPQTPTPQTPTPQTPTPQTPTPQTPAQQTPQPPLPPPVPVVQHHVCVHHSSGGIGTYYDITADATQTVLKRYSTATSPAPLIGVHVYAAVPMPNPAGTFWGDGVAYAAAMQTINAWMYPGVSQTWAAYWDILGVDGDRWRFYASGGVIVMLSTLDCGSVILSDAPPAQQTPQPPLPPPTSAPTSAPTPAPVSHHVCVTYSSNGVGTHYDIVADSTHTVMKRYSMASNPPSLIDTNHYGAAPMPNPAGSFWGDGVAFAATMQTRNAWMYPGASQTSAAYWDILGVDGDRWRFYASGGVEVTLATEDCLNL